LFLGSAFALRDTAKVKKNARKKMRKKKLKCCTIPGRDASEAEWYTYIHTYIHTYIYIYTSYLYIYIYYILCMYVCMYVLCVYVCMYVCIYIYIIYIFIYISSSYMRAWRWLNRYTSSLRPRTLVARVCGMALTKPLHSRWLNRYTRLVSTGLVRAGLEAWIKASYTSSASGYERTFQ
jgi:hypothetical protein